MSHFCHLHCHTSYSLLDGAARIDSLVGQAKNLGMNALGISDHGNLYGVPEFYTIAKRNGIQPIIGCEFYLCASPMNERTDRVRYHQILWAKNETGYRNLIKLSSLSFLDGFYFKPRIDFELLAKYREGLVASTCCMQGQVPQAIIHGNLSEARSLLKKYIDLFGTEDYFVEIQDHGIEEQALINETLLGWADEFNLDVVATNDVHYVQKEDAFAQDILLCLQTGKDIDDPQRLRFDKKEFYLKSADEMHASLGKRPEAVAWMENSLAIADKCQFELPLGKLLMPHFKIPEEFEGNADKYLKHMVFERGKKRYPDFSESVQNRLLHELGIIREMKYAGYFLIVQDFTAAARGMGVSVGPGRGSAAGSAVAYCLGITNVDPLKYDLLFERFLNPERKSMPDIDIDFDDHGRAKVIDYVVQKYGRQNVSQIVTFGTMGARTVVRDVARVLKIPLKEVNKIAKSIPDGKISLDEALGSVYELKELVKSDREDIQKLLRASRALEGCARHTGVHAAGVIIAPGIVSDYIPVATTKNKDEQVLTTQYAGDWVEDFGLLKMDFLGLSTLTIINDTCNIIQERTGSVPNMDELPLDDAATFDLFQRGDTNAIFQFESDGMRKWLSQLKPTSLDDLIAMNALYRPGPMDLIPNYIRRKHGQEEVKYPHESLEPVLRATYGIPVFQEQVMQMAQVMGGYSLGAADVLRRAMGKKDKSVMKAQRRRFIEGARERGVSRETANDVFDMMDKFAGYGFNKCIEESTLIANAHTGEQVTVRQLHEKGWEGFQVYALTKEGILVPRDVEAVHYNGFKKVFELITQDGRRIRTTSMHRFRIHEGWERLEALHRGDEVAITESDGLPVLADEGEAGICAVETEVHVIWDRILDIIPAGYAHTYDLTVEKDHNYLANGFVVHNSHSVAYSLVAYQTAYLKANYTAEFMAAVLSNVSGDSRKFISILDETRRLGLTPRPPSVTHSKENFSVSKDGTIHFGLSSVKGVARTAVDHIVAIRNEHGPAESLFQFVRRLDPRILNKKSLESLALVGALDRFGHRAQVFNALDSAVHYAESVQRDEQAGQGFLFGGDDSITDMPEPELSECEEWPHSKILESERELAGFYFSGHPLDGWEIEQHSCADINLSDIPALANEEEKPYRTTCGVITQVKLRKTRKGEAMSSATLEDRTGQAELICFPSVHTNAKEVLKENELVMASGEIEETGGLGKILVRRLIPLSALRDELLDNIVVTLDSEYLENGELDLNHFIKACKNNPGDKKLFFKIKTEDQEFRLVSEEISVTASSEFMLALKNVFGYQRVCLEWKEQKNHE